VPAWSIAASAGISFDDREEKALLAVKRSSGAAQRRMHNLKARLHIRVFSTTILGVTWLPLVLLWLFGVHARMRYVGGHAQ